MSLAESMNELTRVARELNAGTEAINLRIQEVERFLQDTHVGIETWVEVEGELLLGYCRMGNGTFRICIKWKHGLDGPLLEARRDVRLRAAASLPALVNAITAAAEALLQREE